MPSLEPDLPSVDVRYLSQMLESSYAVVADSLALAELPELPAFTTRINVDLTGKTEPFSDVLREELSKVPADKLTSDTVVVCHGKPKTTKDSSQRQARGFKGYVERFRFSSNDRGPAFLMLGEHLAEILSSEPDLRGRVTWLPQDKGG